MKEQPQESPFTRACQLGCEVLDKFRHPPCFLPVARALIFYISHRAGVGLGFETGSGFVISRLPFSAVSPFSGAAWSPPVFVTVSSELIGLIAGAEKVWTLVGIMSEKELTNFMAFGQMTSYGADCSVSAHKEAPHETKDTRPEMLFSPDLCCSAVSGEGALIDISLVRTTFSVDKHRNQQVYRNNDVTTAAILGGQVEPAADEMAALWTALRHASAGATASAFDPSFEGEEFVF